MDASDFTTGAVLSQKEDRDQPVAFYSSKMTAIELNYDIHDKEMVAIVATFNNWRRYWDGAKQSILRFGNQHNLEYFTTRNVVNLHVARWAQKFTRYELKMFYRPGNLPGTPDVLSRGPEHCPEKGASSEPIFN
jgi:hypothetical protein